MFRYAATLSRPMSSAVVRSCTTAARRHGSLVATTAAAAAAATCFSQQTLAASSAVLSSRRWCSSKRDPTSSAAPPAPVSPAAEESPSNTPSVAAQLSGLSAEDRARIIAALQQPEKEKSSVMGGGGIGPADGDMVAAFTCGPCDYRMVKRFSKHAYTKGIVIVECPNCRAKHLLADNLGWLEDEAKNIEDILREKGESFVHIGGTAGDYQVMGGEGSDASADPAAAASTADGAPSTTTKQG